jgi:hypothetical protein
VDDNNAISEDVLERLVNYLRETFEPASEVTFSHSYLRAVADQVVSILSQRTDRPS